MLTKAQALSAALPVLLLVCGTARQGWAQASYPLPNVSSSIVDLPDAPGSQPSVGRVSGTVLDESGSVISNASATLKNINTGEKRAATSDQSGYFHFEAVGEGFFEVTVTAPGFIGWAETGIPIKAGEDYDLPRIALKVASTATDVEVTLTQHDIAEEQVHLEEKQRVLGVIPNYYATYVWNAAPLSLREKFSLAWRSSMDPATFVITGIIAGVQQSQDDFPGYGQGASGYAKRYGAVYADGFIGTMIGSAILPSLLHQDPRYYYKGFGTITSRALYAISTTVITKGDNGRWQPNYSNVAGALAAGGISNLYYPASSRNGASTTIDNAMLGVASGAINALVEEFLLRHLTPGATGQGKP
jgi:hypothetical protein